MSIPNLQTFGFSEDYQAVYDLAYRYSRDELYSLCGKMDDEEWFPEDAFRKLGEQGLLGVTVPEEYGCLLYTSPSPRDKRQSRMPSSA